MFYRLCAVFFFFVSLSGCILLPDHVAYEGNVPDGQLSELRIYDAGNFQNPGPDAVDISAINDIKFNLLQASTHSNAYLVAPGKNTIQYKCLDHKDHQELKDFVRYKTKPELTTINVAPNTIYNLGCEWRRVFNRNVPSYVDPIEHIEHKMIVRKQIDPRVE